MIKKGDFYKVIDCNRAAHNEFVLNFHRDMYKYCGCLLEATEDNMINISYHGRHHDTIHIRDSVNGNQMWHFTEDMLEHIPECDVTNEMLAVTPNENLVTNQNCVTTATYTYSGDPTVYYTGPTYFSSTYSGIRYV